MTSDDNNRSLRDAAFLPAGIGLSVRRLCDSCSKPKQQIGGRYFWMGATRLWRCEGCTAIVTGAKP